MVRQQWPLAPTRGGGQRIGVRFLLKPEVSSRKQVHLDQERRSATRLEQMNEDDDEMTTDWAK